MQINSPDTALNGPNPGVIYVVDDDGDLRRSLHFLLKTSSLCVSPFASGAQFLNELDALQPAPIILDIRMADIDGTAVLMELARRKIKWPVIVLTGHGEIGLAVECLKLGAFDFLEKPPKAESLLKAIEAAFHMLNCQAEVEQSRRQAQARLASLTCREIEVLDRLCEGRTNKQVAFDLSISPRTVEMHRANALRHLGVRSLIEAGAIRVAAVSSAPSDPTVHNDLSALALTGHRK